MISTMILFLNMLKGDIKRYIFAKNNSEMLTGQTISKDEIESLYSYKLMNDNEKAIVLNILDSMLKSNGAENEKILLKTIPGLVPKETEMMDFKDAA